MITAERRHFIGGAQVLARIEHLQVPVGLGMGLFEIEQRRQQRQVPGQLSRGARAQPLPLPVVAAAEPVDGADDRDDADLTDRPHPRIRVQRMPAAVPAERQRQDGAQYGEGAQQVDGPEAAAVAVAVVNRDGVEARMRIGQRCNQGLQCRRRSRRGRARRQPQALAQQQQLLHRLVERHHSGGSTIS